VTQLSWSPDGKLLASGGSDAAVRLWTADGAPAGVLQGHTDAVEVVAWSPDGIMLASGSDDTTVRRWTFR
jgi:WD40 repeat protein